jgi:nitric oxide reductase subunit B
LLSAAAFFVLLIKAIQNGLVKKSDYRSVISLTLAASSLLYHIIGAALLGLFLAYPATHQYIKGTYIVSAHSHLALFGVFGFLALSVAVSVLLEFVPLSKNENRRCLGGILLLHGGMLTMAVGLVLAGGLQTYLLRVLNVDMSIANVVLRPYLFLRIGGGILYMLGSLLVAYTILKAVWQQREVVFGYGSNQGSQNSLYKSYKRLLKKQSELIPVIQRITILQKIQVMLNKLAKK